MNDYLWISTDMFIKLQVEHLRNAYMPVFVVGAFSSAFSDIEKRAIGVTERTTVKLKIRLRNTGRESRGFRFGVNEHRI